MFSRALEKTAHLQYELEKKKVKYVSNKLTLTIAQIVSGHSFIFSTNGDWTQFYIFYSLFSQRKLTMCMTFVGAHNNSVVNQGISLDVKSLYFDVSDLHL